MSDAADASNGIVWDLPGGAPAAGALAALAALLTLTLVVRALRRRPGSRRLPAWGAAVARAAAVASALLAAAAPQWLTFDGTLGERAVAAHADARLDATADRVLRWPDDVDDAAAALEIARAAAAPDEPLDLTLAPGPTTPTGDAVERGLRASQRVRTSVLAPGTSAAGEAPATAADAGPSPLLVAPSGATEDLPVTLEMQAARGTLRRGVARLQLGDRNGTFPVAPGQRRQDTPPVDLPAGTHLARLHIPGHSPAVAFVQVGRAPHVVYVAAGAAGHPFPATLAAQGLPVTALEPGDAAREGFGRADVVVLGPGATGAALAARVTGRVRAGAGLLVLGGAGDDGLRRHAGTAVAALLPVTLPEPPPPEPPEPDPPQPPPPEPPENPPTDENPDVRMDEGPKEALRVALLLVIDRSGSMRDPKIRLAKMAAIAAARTLSAEDRVGVLAFDDHPKWIAPFQDAGDLTTLGRRVGGLQPGGGTYFFPALSEGFDEIARQRCGIRHVILLSDGVSRDAVYGPLFRKATGQGVTLSTVAIGDGADSAELGRLAGWGKGRLYLATDPQRLPELVTVDTRRFTVDERDRRLEELEDPEGLPEAPPERDPPEDPTAELPEPPDPGPSEPPQLEADAVAPRVPRVLAGAAFLEGLIDAAWPAFPHPEEPTARGIALEVLGWDGDVPALVLGRSGEARVAVLAADAATEDAAALFAWEHGAAFLAQLVRSLAEPPDPSTGGVVATVTRALDGSARIAVPLDAEGMLRLRPDDAGGEIALRCGRLGGGWTGGRLPAAPRPGVWSGVFVPTTAGVTPREVALVSLGAARGAGHSLSELADASGARLVDALPAARPATPHERREPASAALLGAAAALLLLEAALRRLA